MPYLNKKIEALCKIDHYTFMEIKKITEKFWDNIQNIKQKTNVKNTKCEMQKKYLYQ